MNVCRHLHSTVGASTSTPYPQKRQKSAEKASRFTSRVSRYFEKTAFSNGSLPHCAATERAITDHSMEAPLSLDQMTVISILLIFHSKFGAIH